MGGGAGTGAVIPSLPSGGTKIMEPDRNGNAVISTSDVAGAAAQARQDAQQKGQSNSPIAVVIPILAPGQSQTIGQGQPADQSQSTGQSQTVVQGQPAGQGQSANQDQPADQSQAAVQSQTVIQGQPAGQGQLADQSQAPVQGQPVGQSQAAWPTPVGVIFPAQTLDCLVQESVQSLEMRVDGNISVYFNQNLLKWLDAAAGERTLILRIRKLTPDQIAQQPEAAAAADTDQALVWIQEIQTRQETQLSSVYELTLAYLSGGVEIPVTSLEGRTITVQITGPSIAGIPAAGENLGSLAAFCPGDTGQLQWLAGPRYDPLRKTVIFETSHTGLCGVGNKSR